MFHWLKKTQMVSRDDALGGRPTPLTVANEHAVFGRPIMPPFDQGMTRVLFGMGCFWGAERVFWQIEGVHTTAVGYAAGFTPNPTYEEVCSGMTGHNEVVLVVFDPSKVSFETLLKSFWERHDPTQGMRQGNDVGTQYRSGIYCSNEEQMIQAQASGSEFQNRLTTAGFGPITTEIQMEDNFFYAETYHQQYLEKNPNGYCGLGGTGVTCDFSTGITLDQK